jgi:hypothetical protein
MVKKVAYICAMNNAQNNTMSPAVAAVYARIEKMNVSFLQEMYQDILTTISIESSVVRAAIYRALENKMGEDAAFDWVDSVEAGLYA